MMDILQYYIYTYINKWYIYKILIQSPKLASEGQKLYWQLHIDFCVLHILFLALILGLSESEKKYVFLFHKKVCLDIKKQSTCRTWRRGFVCVCVP